APPRFPCLSEALALAAPYEARLVLAKRPRFCRRMGLGQAQVEVRGLRRGLRLVEAFGSERLELEVPDQGESRRIWGTEGGRCFAYAEAILLDLRRVTLQAEHLHLRHQALANQEGFIKDLLATLLSGLSLKDWPLATLVLEPNRNMEVECRASQPMVLYHLVFLEELIRVLRPLVSLEELDRMLGLLDHLTELEDYHRGCFLLLRCWESRHFLIERINMDTIKVPLEKRGIKLLQSFQEGSQPRRIADTVPTEVLLSSRGYSAILTALQEKYAPVLEASGPKAIDRFLFEGERQKGESYTSFIAAKEIARQEMESFLGEKVCDKLCGRILLRQAGLNELQREMITLKGPILRGFNEFAEMLRPLDRPEMLARGEDTKVTKNFHQEHYLQEFPESYDYDHYSGNFEDHEDHVDYPYEYEPEWEYEDEPENPVAVDDEGNAHFFMEDREYTEEESKYLEAYVSAYRDVRKELQKRRTDRGTSEDLILRTRCFNCNELGHYAKDCPLQTKGAGKSTNKKMFVVSSGNNTTTQPMVFMTTTNLKEMPQTDARTTQPTLAKRLMIFAGVKCRPQEALVDTAAEDAVIGSTAMRQLTIKLHRRGLRPLPVSAGVPLPGAGGIGGAAVVESMMEVVPLVDCSHTVMVPPSKKFVVPLGGSLKGSILGFFRRSTGRSQPSWSKSKMLIVRCADGNLVIGVGVPLMMHSSFCKSMIASTDSRKLTGSSGGV
ncbi:unnamed protein product, partial [Effrenium voratum]